VSDLVAFLTARLDEDEAVAKACPDESGHLNWFDSRVVASGDHTIRTCPPSGMVAGEGNRVVCRIRRVDTIDDVGTYDLGDPDARAGHIARHDPARVLREVDAKRKILALHGASIGGTWCVTCDPGSDVSGDAGAWYPCLTLRTLAAVWSGHPDYDPDWA
jgi:hypothetical protein